MPLTPTLGYAIVGLFDEVVMGDNQGKKSKEEQHPLATFLVTWLANLTLYASAIEVAVGILPPRLDWVRSIIFPAIVIASIVAAVLPEVRGKGDVPFSRRWWEQRSVISALVLGLLVVVYLGSVALSPGEYATKEEVIQMLEDAGLNPTQVDEIKKLIDEHGFVTKEELGEMGLNEHQVQEIELLLDKWGYVRKEEVVAAISTQGAVWATQTAVAGGTECLVKPEVNLKAVTIHESPSVTSPPVGYLYQGEVVRAIGYSGDRLNQDRWWLVEIKNGKTSYGWVASWVVQEINEIQCLKMP